MANGNLPATRPAGGPPAALAGRQKVGVNISPEARGLRVPNLDLCHKVETAADVRAGKVPGGYVYAKHTPIEQPLVVFLKADTGRKYEAKTAEGVRTLCGSGDGIAPLRQVAHPPGNVKFCGDCPVGSWTTGTEADPRTGKYKRIPPDCEEGAVFLGILPERNCAPFWLRCFNTLRPAAIEFVNRFSMDPDVEAFHQWVVRLTSMPAPGQGGFAWYLPVFTVEQTLPRAQYEALYQAASSLLWSPPLNRSARGGEGAGDEEPEESTPAASTPARQPSTPWQDAPPPSDDDIWK